MKELRFRAWDTSDKDKGPYMLGPYDLTDAIFSHTEIRKMPLMQYTGLKDLNGKEIFEGDIVVAYNAEQTGIDDEQGEIMANVTGKVFFEDGAFHYDGHSAGAIPLNYNIQDIEVIGNIYENGQNYENPDLINPT